MTCECTEAHDCRLVVLTGGPGAGKTAALEVIRKHFCEHVVVLPEAAGILFSGGFPRSMGGPGLRGAQRAIWHVQRELERLTLEQGRAAVILCDRGTVDGAAYWPDPPSSYWADLGVSRESELARYATVIHLRTPAHGGGYDMRSNPLRIESAAEAAVIDDKIAAAWKGHPHAFVVNSTADFLTKIERTVAIIRDEVPSCCHSRPITQPPAPL